MEENIPIHSGSPPVSPVSQFMMENVEIRRTESNDSLDTSGSSEATSDSSRYEEYQLSSHELGEFMSSRTIKWLGKRGLKGLCKDVQTHTRHGINNDPEDLKNREEKFGKNSYSSPPTKNIVKIFFQSLKDPVLLALMFFSFVSIFLGVAFPEEEKDRKFGWIDGGAILIAVFIVSSVASFNDWHKERKFKALTKVSKKVEKVEVIREAKTVSIQGNEILVGDIVVLNAGDKVPADGVLFECHEIRTDESCMTGETLLVKKSLRSDPFMISGTQVGEGCGKMIVCCVGINSEWGKVLQKTLQNERTKTPLEEKLNKLAGHIGKIGIFFAVLTFFVLFIGFIVEKMYKTSLTGSERWKVSDLLYLVRFLVIAITIIVVAVPEGLPLAVTISLAYSVQKMMKDHNLVRHLSACETMGGATNICSDKTGTLTVNQMRVVKGSFGGKMYLKRLPLKKDFSKEYTNALLEGICINSKANLFEDEKHPKLNMKVIGNKTEGALLLFSYLRFERDYRDVRKTIEGNKRVRKIYSFTSEKKRMSTIITNEGRTNYRIYTKGASELILLLCTRYMSGNGIVNPMNDEAKKMFKDHIMKLSKEGLRTIALAYKDIPGEDEFFIESQEMIEVELVLLGIVGIEDPLRENVKESVKQCQKSGIFVRMVTGDNLHTAKHIAKQCGILKDDGIAIEGFQFRQLNDDEVFQLLPWIQVLARSTPTDKYRLVCKLKEKGEVVAVTGDGTNDAPALKEADVGLSMGLSGTSVAREASDIVILNDDFKSIVSSVLWGRTVFENIRKFLQFQLTVNIVALLLTLWTSLSSNFLHLFSIGGVFEPPLTAVQLLWINLIMDSFAALALATEPPLRSLLDRKPYGRKEDLVTTNMWINMSTQSAYQLTVLLLLYYLGVRGGISKNTEVNNSLIFNTFVFCQIFNELNSRKINMEINILDLRGWLFIFKSPIFVLIFIGEIVVQIGMITISPLGVVVNTKPLNWYQWLISISLAICCIPFGYLVRLTVVIGRIVYRKSSYFKKRRQKTKVRKIRRPNKLIDRLKKFEDNQRKNFMEKGKSVNFKKLSSFRLKKVGSTRKSRDTMDIKKERKDTLALKKPKPFKRSGSVGLIRHGGSVELEGNMTRGRVRSNGSKDGMKFVRSSIQF